MGEELGPQIRELGSFLIVRTAGKVVTRGITQLKCRITQSGPELEPKVGTGPNSMKMVPTLAVRESQNGNSGPNSTRTGPNLGPNPFVKDPLHVCSPRTCLHSIYQVFTSSKISIN